MYQGNKGLWHGSSCEQEGNDPAVGGCQVVACHVTNLSMVYQCANKPLTLIVST